MRLAQLQQAERLNQRADACTHSANLLQASSGTEAQMRAWAAEARGLRDRAAGLYQAAAVALRQANTPLAGRPSGRS